MRLYVAMWAISGSAQVLIIISPCFPGDMEELLGPASRDHGSVNLLTGDLVLDGALAGDREIKL